MVSEFVSSILRKAPATVEHTSAPAQQRRMAAPFVSTLSSFIKLILTVLCKVTLSWLTKTKGRKAPSLIFQVVAQETKLVAAVVRMKGCLCGGQAKIHRVVMTGRLSSRLRSPHANRPAADNFTESSK